MKRMIIFLLTVTIFLSGCTFHIFEAKPNNSKIHLADWESWSEYDSPESLLREIKTKQTNNLSHFYVPAIPPEYHLWQIRVNAPYVKIYYSQNGGKTFPEIAPYIEVCYYRTDYHKTQDTLTQLKSGLTPTEDGYYYNKARSTILFSVDNDWISITVPGTLNSYENLKQMCKIKRYPATDDSTP